jgi:glyoxylase-like metal-dependent hydrolase (beta-lactamase superfamily II)
MSREQTRIVPINTGWIEGDLGTYLFWKGEAGKKIWMPVICFYIDTGEHKIMVDTGMSTAERASEFHHKAEQRDGKDAPDALKAMGVDPDEIDIVIMTHLHWDHCQNIKKFRNARLICSAAEIQWAYNPLPLYYRSYESPILGIEPPFYGCQFELVEGVVTIVDGVSVFPTPGHSVGHMSVQVETTAGACVIAGDAIFRLRNLEPNEKERWRYWVPARFVNSIDGWKSVEELDRRGDVILACHDDATLEHAEYPYPGMPLRKRREPKPGLPFFTGEQSRP